MKKIESKKRYSIELIFMMFLFFKILYDFFFMLIKKGESIRQSKKDIRCNRMFYYVLLLYSAANTVRTYR